VKCRICWSIIVGVALVAAAACSSSSGGSPTSGAPASGGGPASGGETAASSGGGGGGEVELSLWHSLSGPSAAALTSLIDQFNGANTGKIKVTATFQGNYSAAQSKYTAAVQSHSTPSIMMMNDVGTQFMIDAGQSTPLWQIAKGDPSFDPSTVPAAVAAYFSDSNGLLSMPFNASQPMMYINTAVAKAAGLDPDNPPATWAEVVQWAEQIKAKTGKYGFDTAFQDSWQIEELTATAGLPFCTPDNGRGSGSATAISVTDPAQIGFLTDIQKMYQSGVALNTGTDGNAANAALSSGKAGISFNSSGTYTALHSASPDIVAVAYPHVGSGGGVVAGGASLWIQKDGHSAGEQQAALKLLLFLHSTDSQVAFWKASGYMPTNTAAATSDAGKALLASDPSVNRMYQQFAANPANNATAGCRMGPFTQIRSAVMDQFTRMLSGGDPKALMATAEQNAAGILKDYASRVGK
jgi:sn-glycerol 3-phosphate transport system substrate-binding protein